MTTEKSMYWNEVHDAAYAKLSTQEWKSLGSLKETRSSGSVVFDDLVAWGRALVKRENGTFYKAC